SCSGRASPTGGISAAVNPKASESGNEVGATGVNPSNTALRADSRLVSTPFAGRILLMPAYGPDALPFATALCRQSGPVPLGVREEELLTVHLVLGYRFLPFRRNQPVDEGLPEFGFHARMLLWIDEDDAVLVEQ